MKDENQNGLGVVIFSAEIQNEIIDLCKKDSIICSQRLTAGVIIYKHYHIFIYNCLYKFRGCQYYWLIKFIFKNDFKILDKCM